MNLSRIRRDSIRKQAELDSRQLPKAAITREPSTNEASASYREWNPLLCVHLFSYYEPCVSCKRTKLAAGRNLQTFLNKLGVALQ